MPMINIQWLKGRSKETKAKLAEVIEQAMQEHAGCKSGDTYINFQDFEKENWAKSGKLLSE